MGEPGSGEDLEETERERTERWSGKETEPGRTFPYQSEGRVEQCDHDVRHCQVDDEEAGGRVHSLVLEDDMTDQDIAEQREDDDEGVGHDEQGFHCRVLGLGPIASSAHEVLPVRESVVGPEV